MNQSITLAEKKLQMQNSYFFPNSQNRFFEIVKPLEVLNYYLKGYNNGNQISDGSVIEHPEIGKVFVHIDGNENEYVSTTYEQVNIELDALQTVQFLFKIQEIEDVMRKIIDDMNIDVIQKANEAERIPDANTSKKQDNQDDQEKLKSNLNRNGTSHTESLIQVRTANQRLKDAQDQPELSPLFGLFWQTSEVTILAGDTGVGKTLLGVGIADAISSGKQQYLSQKVEVPDQGEKVLYFDFELPDRGFEIRYRGHEFSDNLEFGNINQNYYGDEEFCMNSIRKQVSRSKAKIIIIDNISALSLKSTADADEALYLIKNILLIARRYDLSVLIMAHVPKGKSGKPLDADDVAGSKLITNHVDSVFFIARSKEDNQRYLKQVKARNCEQKSKCDLIEIISEPYVHFEHLSEYREIELLPVYENESAKIEFNWSLIFAEKEELKTAEIVEIAMKEYDCKRRTVEDKIKQAVGTYLEKVKYGVYILMQVDESPQSPQAHAESAELRSCGNEQYEDDASIEPRQQQIIDTIDDSEILEYAKTKFAEDTR